jgi:hypothetical protein
MAIKVSGSTSIGNSIVTEGLAFYADAANPSSYAGSGTTWYDITTNSRNGTLTNTPTYTKANAGGIIFNSGSQQLFSFPNVPITTEAFAFDFWIKPAAYLGGSDAGGASWPGMLSTVNIVDYLPIPGTTTGVAIGFYGSISQVVYAVVCTGSFSTAIPFRSWENSTGSATPYLTTSSIYNIIIQRNTDTSHIECYINGVYYSKIYIPNPAYSISGSIPLRSSIRSPSSIDSYYPNGTYYNIKIYKGKYLTQAEVTQNYNALKRRYT